MVKSDVDTMKTNATANASVIMFYNSTTNSTYAILNPNATSTKDENGDDCPEPETGGTKIVWLFYLVHSCR